MKLNYTEPFNFKPIPSITVASDYWQNGTWKFGSLEITPDTAYAPSWQEVTLSGLGALTLINALPDSLLSLKLFGGTELLPETYIDSVTAEGKCEQRNLPEGYTEYDGLIGDGNAYIDLNCTLNQNDEIEIEFTMPSTTISSRTLFGYRDSATDNNISVFISRTDNTCGLDWNNSDYNAYRLLQLLTASTRYKAVLNKTGRYIYDSTGTLVASNTTACNDTITTGNAMLFYLGGNPAYVGSGTKFNGTIHRCLIKGKLDVVPAGNGTAYGMYDKLNGVFYPNVNNSGSFSVGSAVTTPSPSQPMDIWCNNGVIGYDTVNQQITVTGTPETITDNQGNVATCENLLSVGTYKDTQEILSGAVTRNIGIKVLDGTEDWKKGTSFYTTSETFLPGYQGTHSTICTHYEGVTTNTTGIGDSNTIKVGSDVDPNNKIWGRIYIYADRSLYATAQDFSDYLADQYNAGTPVIIVYPLATATTETVTGQQLNKTPLTYAGSVSGLTGTVVTSSHTTPTPTQPLQINCNNGVVKWDSTNQTIYTDGRTETVEVHGKNLYNPATRTDGYYISVTGEVTENEASMYSDYIKVTPSEKYTISLIVGNTGNVNAVRVHAYTSNKAWISQISATTTGNVGSSYSATFTIPNNAEYIRFGCRKVQENIQVELGSTATTYSPYFNGGTATAQDLYAVGTYKDVQSVLDGNVTRQIGIKVFNGTENWASASSASLSLFYTEISNMIIGSSYPRLCSHAIQVFTTSGMSAGQFFCGGSTTRFNFAIDRSYNLTTFKQWLAQQYNSGTPVIVIYPLATATTSSVTAQSLTTQEGTNIVEITQASMSNLPLEVSYKAGVTVTVTEVENAQLSNSVTVTID